MPGLPMRRKRSAAIEGLPLYLLIIIIITAVSIGIVMGLLNMAKPPQTLGTIGLSQNLIEVKDPNGDGTYDNTNFNLIVNVTDGSGNRLSGAVVTLSGDNVKEAGSSPHQVTNSRGEAVFTGLSCSVIGTSPNPITVTVEKSGYGKKTIDLPVVIG